MIALMLRDFHRRGRAQQCNTIRHLHHSNANRTRMLTSSDSYDTLIHVRSIVNHEFAKITRHSDHTIPLDNLGLQL
jgi:hypothetical protein